MFDRNKLYDNPLIQTKNTNNFPTFLRHCYPNQIALAIEYNRIEKIVAMRVFPQQNKVAFKIKYFHDKNFHSELIENIKLDTLKIIHDLNHDAFCFAIKYYLLGSPNASKQFIEKMAENDVLHWYNKLTLGD